MSNRVKRRRADAVDTRASAEGHDIGSDVVDRLETPDRELFDRYRASAERLPRTDAGRKLLDREAYNGRSFALITAADIIAIEDEAALRLSENDR